MKSVFLSKTRGHLKGGGMDQEQEQELNLILDDLKEKIEKLKNQVAAQRVRIELLEGQVRQLKKNHGEMAGERWTK